MLGEAVVFGFPLHMLLDYDLLSECVGLLFLLLICENLCHIELGCDQSGNSDGS